MWEEENKRFRMLPGKWDLYSSLVELATGKIVNVTAVERVSHYNSVSFQPDGRKLLMTSLINGVSKPFVMDLDGRIKRDVSGEYSGFTYGYSAPPRWRIDQLSLELSGLHRQQGRHQQAAHQDGQPLRLRSSLVV